MIDVCYLDIQLDQPKAPNHVRVGPSAE